MKHFATILSSIFVVSGIGYCIFRVWENYKTIPDVNIDLLMVAKLIIIVPVISASFLLISDGWRLLLTIGGFLVSIGQSFAIMGISQIGKYLPGNVFHYVGRVAMGSRQGISSYPFLCASVWLETLLMLVAASLIIFAGATADREARILLSNVLSNEIIWALFLVLGLIVASVVGWHLLRRKIEPLRTILKPTILCRVTAHYLIFFLLYGFMVKVIPLFMWGEKASLPLALSIWRFTLCWVAGFIVPGAPAGLGVREAMFTKLFSPELGEGGAACVALVFRILTTAGDLLTFAVAWWVGRRALNSKTQ